MGGRPRPTGGAHVPAHYGVDVGPGPTESLTLPLPLGVWDGHQPSPTAGQGPLSGSYPSLLLRISKLGSAEPGTK